MILFEEIFDWIFLKFGGIVYSEKIVFVDLFVIVVDKVNRVFLSVVIVKFDYEFEENIWSGWIVMLFCWFEFKFYFCWNCIIVCVWLCIDKGVIECWFVIGWYY